MSQLRPVFLSDVIGVINKYSEDKAILPRLTIGLCVFSKAENLGRFYEPPGIMSSVKNRPTFL